MFEKLQADHARFQEIDRALLDPEITRDPVKVAALSRERGTLAKIAIPYGRYLEIGRLVREAEALEAAETDYEMRSYRRPPPDSPPVRRRWRRDAGPRRSLPSRGS